MLLNKNIDNVNYELTECFIPQDIIDDKDLKEFSITLNELPKITVNNRVFIKVPCEYVRDKIVNYDEGKLMSDVVIHYPKLKLKYLISSESKVHFIEVVGKNVYVLVNEGEKVKSLNKIAYIVTGKREVRVVRSPFSGVIIFIFYYPLHKPEKYVFVIVGEDLVRKV